MDFAASLSRGWQMGIGAALVLAIAAFGVLILHRKRRKRESVARGPDAARRTAQDAAAKPSGVEKKFKTIFFNKSEADLERTIALWMNKKQCSRDAAMQHAIEHYQQETRSWR